MCDECEAVWTIQSEIMASNVLYPIAPEYVVPGLSCSIAGPESLWATMDQVIGMGCSIDRLYEGKALDE